MTCYALYASDEPEALRYVGATRRQVADRLADHLAETGTSLKCLWVAGVRARGAHVLPLVLSVHATECEMLAAELAWIGQLSQTHDLCNGGIANPVLTVIGMRVVFTGGPCAALVDVVDARTAFGRDDYKVRDCLGRERWVSAGACSRVASADTAGSVAMMKDEQ